MVSGYGTFGRCCYLEASTAVFASGRVGDGTLVGMDMVVVKEALAAVAVEGDPASVLCMADGMS